MNVILGISGGIAAYKAPDLVRRLRERGASVQIVLTASAEEFVTETALQAVSGNPIRDNLWDKEAEAAMSHIELARWADLVLIAPATAEVMARLASGGAPDLLSTLCLATTAPVALAPAMNHAMWSHPAVQANRATLAARGIHFFGPDVGSQACGETGAGRMQEPTEIADRVYGVLQVSGAMQGKTVLLTAGPTREPVDPVRYISNRSSGKMGYAMARAAQLAGANVVLVSGPVSLEPPTGVELVSVNTAEEMYDACHRYADNADIFIAAAAVADYRPATCADNKIKKSADQTSITMVKTQDILASISALKGGPFAVGFAAETENLEEHALRKLHDKQLEMIIANRVGENLAFDCDTNAVEVYWRTGHKSFATAPKTDLAKQLMELIAERFAAA